MPTASIAVLFPGQGSQAPGMGRELAESIPEAGEVFDRVSDALGRDIRATCWESDAETLRQTQNAQLALFTAGMAAYKALKPLLPGEHVLAGHSIGEYAAVVASGALSLEEGAKLVQIRGALMADSGRERPGTMAAVLGLDRDDLERVCRDASTESSVVVIANDNCPGQTVISGDTDAVQRASSAATDAGAKRVLPLNVSGAFHSPLMEEAATRMGDALCQAAWSEQKLLVYSNVTSEAVEHGREWTILLEKQLKSPVRWTEVVQHMARDGIGAVIECGVGEVLCGLVKRTEPSLTQLKVNDVISLESTQSILADTGAVLS